MFLEWAGEGDDCTHENQQRSRSCKVCAAPLRLLMCTETGTEAHSIVDNTPAETGLEAWRRLVERFDPWSAHANLNIMSKILRPPKGKFDNISLLMQK